MAKDDESKKDEAITKKVFDICDEMINRVHRQILSGAANEVIPTEEMKNLLLIVREAWFTKHSDLAQLLEYGGDGEDDGDEDAERKGFSPFDDDEEEDDGPPHPLK